MVNSNGFVRDTGLIRCFELLLLSWSPFSNTHMFFRHCRFTCLLILANLFGPSSWRVDADTTDTKEGKPTFAWKVTDPKTKKKAYLVGCIHLGKESDYPLPDVIEKAFAESDALAVEVVIDSRVLKYEHLRQTSTFFELINLLFLKILFLEIITSLLLLKNPFLPRLKEIPIHIAVAFPFYMLLMLACRNTEESWLLYAALQHLEVNKVLQFLIFFCMTPTQIRRMLNREIRKKVAGITKFGTEQHFISLAKEAGKPVIALETIADQVNILSQLKLKPDFATFKSFLEDIEASEAILAQIHLAWQTGNTELMEQAAEYHDTRIIDHRKLLLTDRNIIMADKIKAFLNQDQTVFVLVGAMHYVGKEGILALLEKDGYLIEQLYS